MTRATETQMTELRSRLQEVMDLRAAVALLRWDQVTYMPPGGAAARCRQLALLTRAGPRKIYRSRQCSLAGCPATLRRQPP